MANDMTIIFGIMAFFIGLGIIIPYVNAEYGTGYTEFNIDGFEDNVVAEQGSVGSVLSGWSVLGSVLSMFFWSLAGISVWVNLILMPVRIIFWLTIIRNIWVGGGS